MAAVLLALPLVLMLGVPVASAVALELGWTSEINWDSNVLRSEDDEESDFSFYGGPNLTVRERGHTLDYALGYRVRYDQYVELSDVNGFEHFVTGQGTWRASQKTRLHVDQAFSRTRALNTEFDVVVPGIDPVGAVDELLIARTLTYRNTTSGSLVHDLSRRWSLENNFDFDVFDYEDELRAGNLSFRGGTQLIYAIAPLTQAGFGVGATRQVFGDTDFSKGQASTFYESFAVFRHQFSKTASLSFSGGPAWSAPDDLSDDARAPRNGIRRDAAGAARLADPTQCLPPTPDLPAGTQRVSACSVVPNVVVDGSRVEFNNVDRLGELGQDGQLTFFGQALLLKSWSSWIDSRLSYTRRASTSTGLGQSTDLDEVVATVTMHPDRRRWRIDLRAAWSRQTAANDVPLSEQLISTTPVTVYVDADGRIYSNPVPGATPVTNASRVVAVRTAGFTSSDLEINTYRFDVRASRRLGERFYVNLAAGYWQQDIEGTFQVPRTVDNIHLELGFTWNLAPIDL